ncbi:hypothetical protein [Pseudomonas orientalis]|uniref:Uncharacterized protein n=1 Tax=Pseudomonas orientalis TaxID=76758 RepID=A0A0R2ZZS0_9PSED|nr:hypothetical protein [Pseudomonas orientalis]AZE87966.1 hypothetical protein C4J97_1249 [Pseudomonas orientalis]KRP66274.1 hypothetical protein TU82_11000 [Pseudomonas orientalis]SDU34712.1 hypothetical protein SAMN04490197_5154 [Pseudomonas orientalis]
MGLFIGKSLTVSVNSGFGSIGGGWNCAKPKPPADDCNDKCKPKPDCDGRSNTIKFGVSVMPLGAIMFGGLAGKLF